jgi:hypothetical protein
MLLKVKFLLEFMCAKQSTFEVILRFLYILFERGLQGKKGYFSCVIFEQISELAYRYDVNVNQSPYIFSLQMLKSQSPIKSSDITTTYLTANPTSQIAVGNVRSQIVPSINLTVVNL